MKTVHLFLILLLTPLAALSNAASGEFVEGTKTGYYTYVNLRESPNDMPRRYHLLIGEDGEITLFGYERYKGDKPGALNSSTMDTRDYFGKCITIRYDGVYHLNNKQYNVMTPSGELRRIPKIRLSNIYGIDVVNKPIDVDPQYRYANSDTLVMLHGVTAPEKRYKFTPKEKVVTISLNDFVKGEGTAASPYISNDGSAGLQAAIKKIGNKIGVIEVGKGVYRIDVNNIEIPLGVSLKGEGEQKSRFMFTQKGETWMFKGENTIEHLSVDIKTISEYCHTVIVDDNARNVTFRHITMDGGHSVDGQSLKWSKNVCGIGLKSYISNITLEGCTFHNVFRSLQSKGQKEHHGITVRNCLFDGWSYTPISLDQTSNITDVVIENNQFRDFCHFGVAFARITNVTLRNNIFYSHQKIATEHYNQAIHLEDHCQRFLIENNDIDVIMRSPEGKASYRNAAVAVGDGRLVMVRNNNIKNSSITIHAGETEIGGYTTVVNNRIDNGSISVSACRGVRILDNTITNSPEAPLLLLSNKVMDVVCSDIVIKGNSISKFKNYGALILRGYVEDVRVEDNSFSGEDYTAAAFELRSAVKGIVLKGNSYTGLDRNSIFAVKGEELPTGYVTTFEGENSIK